METLISESFWNLPISSTSLSLMQNMECSALFFTSSSSLPSSMHVRERQAIILGNTGTEIYVNLQCRFHIVNEDCGLMPSLILAKEEFTWKHLSGFICLIYPPFSAICGFFGTGKLHRN
ncbi:hypothetical protein TorRG33x02_356240 [Trema orientale]|uniref:Uncharacterized protein n=1 Tax=Trema orientale TaxID=63057 RepID=A0A2P5A7L4_TREOI|nr:hypothetical protein TorRG33x02_356240 [Trema orientale]